MPRLTCSALLEEANKPSLSETERRCCLLLLLKLAGSLPEAVPPRHSGNHRPFTSAWTFLPQNRSTSTSGNWDRGTDPTAFPSSTAKDETGILCAQRTGKKSQKKPKKKPRQAEKLAHPPAKRKVFQHTAAQEEMQALPCCAGLHPDLTAKSSPKAARVTQNHVKSVTSRFQFIPRPGTGGQLPTAASGLRRIG